MEKMVSTIVGTLLCWCEVGERKTFEEVGGWEALGYLDVFV